MRGRGLPLVGAVGAAGGIALALLVVRPRPTAPVEGVGDGEGASRPRTAVGYEEARDRAVARASGGREFRCGTGRPCEVVVGPGSHTYRDGVLHVFWRGEEGTVACDGQPYRLLVGDDGPVCARAGDEVEVRVGVVDAEGRPAQDPWVSARPGRVDARGYAEDGVLSVRAVQGVPLVVSASVSDDAERPLAAPVACGEAVLADPRAGDELTVVLGACPPPPAPAAEPTADDLARWARRQAREHWQGAVDRNLTLEARARLVGSAVIYEVDAIAYAWGLQGP